MEDTNFFFYRNVKIDARRDDETEKEMTLTALYVEMQELGLLQHTVDAANTTDRIAETFKKTSPPVPLQVLSHLLYLPVSRLLPDD